MDSRGAYTLAMEAHFQADTTSPDAIHHRIGFRSDEVASGNHYHWGPWEDLIAAKFSPHANLINYGGIYRKPQIRKSLNGRDVEIRGLAGVQTATIVAGTTVLTLPTEYCPGAAEVFPIDYNAAHNRFDVTAAGLVSFALNVGTGTSISLAKIGWNVK